MSVYKNVAFAGNQLQTANIIVTDIDSESIPTKDAKLYTLGHANSSRIPFTSYPTKTIKLTGYVIGSSVADLDAQLDTFRGYFNLDNQNLDIDYGAVQRRYTATVNTLGITRPGGLVHAPFTIEFLCTTPFGTNTTTTSAVSVTGATASSRSDSYTFLGNAPYQRPIATMTFTALTGGTNATVSFGNNGNGQQITTVPRTWAVNDVLVIDTTTKSVTVNGLPVDYSGAFPEFAPGVSQTLGYSDTFTTRTFNYSVVYYPAFL